MDKTLHAKGCCQLAKIPLQHPKRADTKSFLYCKICVQIIIFLRKGIILFVIYYYLLLQYYYLYFYNVRRRKKQKKTNREPRRIQLSISREIHRWFSAKKIFKKSQKASSELFFFYRSWITIFVSR